MVVLRGCLSNRELAASLYSLTVALRDQVKEPRRERAKRFAYAEGRRRFGTVGGAVVEVLEEACEPIRLKAIHEAVENKLDDAVSLNTVQDYLRRRAKGPRALFERPSYGHYRLRATKATRPRRAPGPASSEA
jgi:hypothetical protein